MSYKIKSKTIKQKLDKKSFELQLYHYFLEEEAYNTYGSEYKNLTEKEQKSISKKVARDLISRGRYVETKTGYATW